MPDTTTTGTAIAHIPARINLDLCAAVGRLIDAALGGANLNTGNGREIAGTVVLRDDQTQDDAVRQLNAATRRITRRPLQPGPLDEPAEEPDPEHPMTLNRISETDTGQIEFGMGGSEQLARAMARQLLSVFIPAFADLDAPNYLSWDLVDPDTNVRYSLIIVKPGGLTPHEARDRAEQECARLRTELRRYGIETPDA